MPLAPSAGFRAAVALVAVASLVAIDGAAAVHAAPKLTVMTRNVYIGADLTPLLMSPADQIATEAAKIMQRVRESDPPGRMQAVAREIAIAQPAIVGVQEVALFQTIVLPVDGVGRPAITTAYDFRRLLLNALAAQGTPYSVVTQVKNTSVTAPTGGNTAVKVTDRDLLLARAGGRASAVRWTNARSRRFVARLPGVVRGYNLVDFTVHGRPLRVVNTHLEILSLQVRNVQARELLRGPLRRSAKQPQVLLGDINSDPGATGMNPYDMFAAAGFADAWKQANPGTAGLTCCFGSLLTDADASAFHERIDMVMSRGATGPATSATLFGTDPANRTPSGRWASDHAGLAARLKP